MFIANILMRYMVQGWIRVPSRHAAVPDNSENVRNVSHHHYLLSINPADAYLLGRRERWVRKYGNRIHRSSQRAGNKSECENRRISTLFVGFLFAVAE